MIEQQGRNVSIPMTRRYPILPQKLAMRDSKIAKQLVHAWDVFHSEEAVFNIFKKDNALLSDPRYWELLKTVWIIAGSVANADTFRSWMLSKRGYKSYFMTPEEKEHLDRLSEQITVYRAYNGRDRGIAYTLSLEYAMQYKNRFAKEHIEARTIQKSECFAFINRNAEDEILILS